MADETRKIAEAYVKQQLNNIDGKVPARQIREAVRKVEKAIEEIRTASATRDRSCD
jgi:hypothetical protein